MIQTNKSKILINVLLLLVSSSMFWLSNPNSINTYGFGFLGFLFFIPVLILINQNSYKHNYILGFLFGYLSYSLYGYWLGSYGVFVKIFSFSFYGILWGFVFLIIKFVDQNFKKYSFLVIFLIILSFEYLKTKGFLGFGYGITGYTQWQNLRLIQIADLFGVFGVSSIVIFPSCVIFEIYKRIKMKSKMGFDVIISFLIWCVMLILSLCYGNYRLIQNEKKEIKENVSIALIQNNEDPFGNGFEHYRRSVQKLIDITNQVTENHPNIELVVWPETAVVPSINHFYSEEESNRKLMITALLHYFESKNCDFVIGNAYTENTKEYNSALYFTKGNILPPNPQVYSKTKLVPFSEHLPFGIKSDALEKAYDFHFWDKGKKVEVLNMDKISFGTPICFEDTFDFISRKMKNLGAAFFVNSINDSWGKSVVCQNQHLAIGVFRAVENKIPSVRCAVSGQTCYVSAIGKVENCIEPFSEGYAYVEVPIYENISKTLYSRIGNLFMILILILCLILLLNKLFFVIIK